MSRWKFTKEDLKEIEKMPLEDFMIGYEIRVSEMLTQLSKIVEYSCTHNRPFSKRGLYILRQMSVNIEKFNLIFRRKSIELMKQEENSDYE